MCLESTNALSVSRDGYYLQEVTQANWLAIEYKIFYTNVPPEYQSDVQTVLTETLNNVYIFVKLHKTEIYSNEFKVLIFIIWMVASNKPS